MIDKELVRGLLLVAIALGFGLQSLTYKIGQLENAGPGLFPLIVSSLLLIVSLAIVVQSRFGSREVMHFDVRNIGLIIVSLVGFALLSQYVNMIAAIVFLVFCASTAASSYSINRNIKISAGLIAVAFAFQRFLGFSLPLY